MRHLNVKVLVANNFHHSRISYLYRNEKTRSSAEKGGKPFRPSRLTPAVASFTEILVTIQ